MELPWLKGNFLAAISDDGRQVLFYASTAAYSPITYVRPTDGSSPLKLGPGYPMDFSPDGKWVLVVAGGDPTALSLVPLGLGLPKWLPVEGLNVARAVWLRDGKRIVVTAERKGDDRWRLFVVPLDGGAPSPLAVSRS